MTATLARICRYPVKSLNAELLDRVTLLPGRALPNDRRFAIALGSSVTDKDPGAWQPRRAYLHLARNERLAQLHVGFDDAEGRLTIERNGKPVSRGKVTEPTGRALIGQFFGGFMGEAVRGVPKVVEASDQPYSDIDQPYLSIIGLASVSDLERVVRQPVDPRRFRANLYLEGLPPWAEFGWLDKEITIGATRLKVEGRIERCAATNVNPDTAARDLNIPLALQRGFGHVDVGVYARVLAGGDIAVGDAVATAQG